MDRPCLLLDHFSFNLLGGEEGGAGCEEINGVLDHDRDELRVGKVREGCFGEVAIECMIFWIASNFAAHEGLEWTLWSGVTILYLGLIIFLEGAMVRWKRASYRCDW